MCAGGHRRDDHYKADYHVIGLRMKQDVERHQGRTIRLGNKSPLGNSCLGQVMAGDRDAAKPSHVLMFPDRRRSPTQP